MAKKELNSDVIPSGSLKVINQPGFWYATGMLVIGYVIYRSGYRTGVDVSNRVLRRHDKDNKRMKKEAAKREKQLRKELSPEKEKKCKWWPW